MSAIRGSSYIRTGFDKAHIKRVVSSFSNILRDNVFGEFDGIVCRGTSGLIIAPLLAYEFDKKLLVTRKRGDNSHANAVIEGAADIEKFIIVDDFVSTGNTLKAILNSFEEERNVYSNYNYNAGFYNPVYLGCYFWAESFTNGKAGKSSIEMSQDTPETHRLITNKVFAQFYDNRKKYTIDTFKLQAAEAA